MPRPFNQRRPALTYDCFALRPVLPRPDRLTSHHTEG